MEQPLPKSDHAELLNHLVDMQNTVLYALRKPVLEQAESLIVWLEQQGKEKDATIAALQAKLEDLTAKYQNLVAWYDKQNGTPCEQVRHRQEVEALQARVRELEEWVQDQSTANLETMRHMDEMQSRAMDAESQLTQRTAELERVRGERDNLQLQVHVYQNGDSKNNALVQDIERWRMEYVAQHRQGMEG